MTLEADAALAEALDRRTVARGGQARTITVLGSTGSIGVSTLDIVAHHPEAFRIVALTANRNAEKLADQARTFGAELAVIADETQYARLKELLDGTGIETAAGDRAVVEAAEREAEIVMAAIVGAAGLPPSLAAIRRGCTVALANKETLVCAGEFMMEEVTRHGATLLPVDSEHNAIFQVLDHERPEGIEKIILTASGGPLRTLSLEDMYAVTPAQAVKHPNWSMGAKISVDSASMFNKGLELIEAHHLFQMAEDRIDILVHPQSVIHSMVSYVDGSVLAQLGSPDMRTPIAYSMAWPERIDAPVERLDLAKVATLTFEAPDPVRFPAIRLAREALKAGDCAACVLNAANEVAVGLFLDGKIGFMDIAKSVEETLNRINGHDLTCIDDVFEMDTRARRLAGEICAAC